MIYQLLIFFNIFLLGQQACHQTDGKDRVIQEKQPLPKDYYQFYSITDKLNYYLFTEINSNIQQWMVENGVRQQNNTIFTFKDQRDIIFATVKIVAELKKDNNNYQFQKHQLVIEYDSQDPITFNVQNGVNNYIFITQTQEDLYIQYGAKNVTIKQAPAYPISKYRLDLGSYTHFSGEIGNFVFGFTNCTVNSITQNLESNFKYNGELKQENNNQTLHENYKITSYKQPAELLIDRTNYTDFRIDSILYLEQLQQGIHQVMLIKPESEFVQQYSKLLNYIQVLLKIDSKGERNLIIQMPYYLNYTVGKETQIKDNIQEIPIGKSNILTLTIIYTDIPQVIIQSDFQYDTFGEKKYQFQPIQLMSKKLKVQIGNGYEYNGISAEIIKTKVCMGCNEVENIFEDEKMKKYMCLDNLQNLDYEKQFDGEKHNLTIELNKDLKNCEIITNYMGINTNGNFTILSLENNQKKFIIKNVQTQKQEQDGEQDTGEVFYLVNTEQIQNQIIFRENNELYISTKNISTNEGKIEPIKFELKLQKEKEKIFIKNENYTYQIVSNLQIPLKIQNLTLIQGDKNSTLNVSSDSNKINLANDTFTGNVKVTKTFINLLVSESPITIETNTDKDVYIATISSLNQLYCYKTIPNCAYCDINNNQICQHCQGDQRDKSNNCQCLEGFGDKVYNQTSFNCQKLTKITLEKSEKTEKTEIFLMATLIPLSFIITIVAAVCIFKHLKNKSTAERYRQDINQQDINRQDVKTIDLEQQQQDMTPQKQQQQESPNNESQKILDKAVDNKSVDNKSDQFQKGEISSKEDPKTIDNCKSEIQAEIVKEEENYRTQNKTKPETISQSSNSTDTDTTQKSTKTTIQEQSEQLDDKMKQEQAETAGQKIEPKKITGQDIQPQEQDMISERQDESPQNDIQPEGEDIQPQIRKINRTESSDNSEEEKVQENQIETIEPFQITQEESVRFGFIEKHTSQRMNQQNSPENSPSNQEYAYGDDYINTNQNREQVTNRLNSSKNQGERKNQQSINMKKNNKYSFD